MHTPQHTPSHTSKRLARLRILQSALLFSLMVTTTATTCLVFYTSQQQHTPLNPQTRLLQARSDMQHITSTIHQYRTLHRSIPHTLFQVQHSTHNLNLQNRDLIDPWGKPYAITQRTPSSYTLRSPGPDRTPLTPDDLTLQASFPTHTSHTPTPHPSNITPLPVRPLPSLPNTIDCIE